MFKKGIARRWLFNSLGVMILLFTACIAALSFVVQSYAYNGIQMTLIGRSDELPTVLSGSMKTVSEFNAAARSYTENFPDKDLMEVMAVSRSGSILSTSSGFAPDQNQGKPDFESALHSENGYGYWIGKLASGEKVMAGYWKNPEATADTVRDGWLHTGDMGYLTDDGFLYVLGRFKSLLIASDGEKYSPEGMEEAIADASQLIDQIIVHNNQNPYTVAIVVPNRDELRRRYQTCGNDLAALAREVAGEIDAFRAGGVHAGEFPDRWLPSAVAIVYEAFTEQNGLVNSTMKVVRSRVEEHFRDRLDALYTPEGKRPDSAQNLASLKKLVE